MNERLVALVSGANKGIGLEIAKGLAARGLLVVVGARDLAQGEAAAQKVGSGARAVQLDVTSQASIDAATAWLRTELGRLDVLVNNAAISNAAKPGTSFEDIVKSGRPSVASLDEVRAIFETNVFGVLALTQAVLPLLREAPAARIVNVSSTVGSLGIQGNRENPYRFVSASYGPSKTALNAITVALATELEDTRIKVNAVCPGYTATDLNQFRGTRTVEEGAREPIRMALIGDDGPTGGFSNDEGPLPW